jgi:hypothetical protein
VTYSSEEKPYSEIHYLSAGSFFEMPNHKTNAAYSFQGPCSEHMQPQSISMFLLLWLGFFIVDTKEVHLPGEELRATRVTTQQLLC